MLRGDPAETAEALDQCLQIWLWILLEPCGDAFPFIRLAGFMAALSVATG
jgi:hypothetical protein